MVTKQLYCLHKIAYLHVAISQQEALRTDFRTGLSNFHNNGGLKPLTAKNDHSRL